MESDFLSQGLFGKNATDPAGGAHSSLSAAEPITYGADPLTYQSLNTSPNSPRKRVHNYLVINS